MWGGVLCVCMCVRACVRACVLNTYSTIFRIEILPIRTILEMHIKSMQTWTFPITCL